MKRPTFAAIVLALLLLLTACSPIDSGRITGKHHSDAYWYTTTVCVGKPLICHPQVNYVPARWSFDLEQDDETGWANVSEETFAEYDVGDMYDPEQ